jgi:hypothetical protein
MWKNKAVLQKGLHNDEHQQGIVCMFLDHSCGIVGQQPLDDTKLIISYKMYESFCVIYHAYYMYSTDKFVVILTQSGTYVVKAIKSIIQLIEQL